MFTQLLNWRTLLAFIAIIIVTGTVFYSNQLAKKIATEERLKIQQWVEALKDINNPEVLPTNLSGLILVENSKNIPMIAVTEKDSILDHYNLDTAEIKINKNYLKDKLDEFKKLHEPIEWRNPLDSLQTNRVFYGESDLLKQVRYYPIIQLIIVALFIIITLITISTRNKSTQNQVWAGMAKETAHQLGTPLSSLQGWVEILKENTGSEKIAIEMEKDVDRLKLVSDRFGKIGSTPQLEETNIVTQIENMVTYIKRRATDKVDFTITTNDKEVIALINAPLFDWVIENLLKNALDAMEGRGKINVSIKNEAAQIMIDVTDSGKGISKQNITKVFKPGFTTKKRGWGLGLSLSKRIIEQYHKGDLFVKQSDPNKGTTFRIVLKK
ncbi:HAMP domain-containing histidine kinase [Ferruginibacter lapsinanis]|uniref:sensor histidine kinase n=1 Tax=Ferruginibacter lapsinanis TaxID=563172 RepID=UPI001E328A91|nr:HAMP domain-containing sensor histidine kinase [Ferruginibacter lapsinanis]UEG49890.1 HAMP domain-containing histidine kinase [Ferruginibacter lapsinanis]